MHIPRALDVVVDPFKTLSDFIYRLRLLLKHDMWQ